MTVDPDHWFDDVGDVGADEIRFKAKLAIGEDAYTSTRLKKAVFEAWDIAGVAGTGAQMASSALVAQKFFAAPGLLGALGIGTAATPIGWVIAAGVISGGAWFGITRYLKSDGDKTTVIPKFINSPIDVLGLTLFDLIAPLAIRVAAIDGEIDPREREHIVSYFVRAWGYSEAFVTQGLAFVEDRQEDYDTRTAAKTLAAFVRENPDCRAQAIVADIVTMLTDVMEADGRIDEREEMAIERIEKVFAEEMQFSISRTVAPVGKAASNAVGRAGSTITDAGKTASALVGRAGTGLASAVRRPWNRDADQ